MQKFRLYSDQSLIRIELQQGENRPAILIAEKEHRCLTREVLTQWLTGLKKINRKKMEIILHDDLFRIIEGKIEPERQQAHDSPIWLRQLQESLAPTEQAEQFYADVLIEGATCRLFLIEKAALTPYLDACRACKIKLVSVHPASAPSCNVLPWRVHRQKRQSRTRVFFLLGLPLLSLLPILFFHQQAQAQFVHERKQQQNLTAEINLLLASKNAIPVSEIGALLDEMKHVQGRIIVHEIRVNAPGEVTLAGRAPDHISLDRFLQQLNSVSEFQHGSLHHLTIHEQKQAITWQVEFDLQQRAA